MCLVCIVCLCVLHNCKIDHCDAAVTLTTSDTYNSEKKSSINLAPRGSVDPDESLLYYCTVQTARRLSNTCTRKPCHKPVSASNGRGGTSKSKNKRYVLKEREAKGTAAALHGRPLFHRCNRPPSRQTLHVALTGCRISPLRFHPRTLANPNQALSYVVVVVAVIAVVAVVPFVTSFATPTAHAAGGLRPDRGQGRLGRPQRHLDRGGGRVRRGLGLVRRRDQG